MNDFHEIEEMTLREYRLRMKAYQLKRLDKDRDLHLQAWVNQAAKARKQVGKVSISKWKDFDSFFNFKAQEDELLGRVKRSTMEQRVIDYREGKKKNGK